MMGASAGLTFRYQGLLGRFGGSWLRAALMAACTSRAAASMFRFRSNWRTTVVAPSRLVDVISVTPAMRPNCRSSGVATAEAMVSGLAPGRMAWTWMTGNSTWGSGATGSRGYAMMPASRSPSARSEVPMGRRMKGAEIFMILGGGLCPPSEPPPEGRLRGRSPRSKRPLRWSVAQTCAKRACSDRLLVRRRGRGRRQGARGRRAPEPPRKAIEVEIDDGGGVERQDLREDEATHDRDAQRPPQLGARARPERQRQAAQERRHRRHHDGTEA